MEKLKLFLFGQNKLIIQENCVDIQPTVLLLLSFFMTHPHETHTRDELATLFWANSDDRSARKALNTSLWRLRKTIENKCYQEPFIVTTSRTELTLNWDAPFWCDAVQFEQTLTPVLELEQQDLTDDLYAQMEQSLRLYHGDLLAGYYEDWVIRKREQLRAIRLRTLDHLLRFYIDQNSLPEVIRIGRQILDHDPLREDIYRKMMRAYASMGKLEAARQLYQQCSRELGASLNVAPLPETRQTLQKLQHNRAQQSKKTPIPAKTISLIRKELLEAQELIRQALDKLNHL